VPVRPPARWSSSRSAPMPRGRDNGSEEHRNWNWR
jgi:hypothetical protein